MSSTSKKIASMLLQIGAIRLSPAKPFTWASGWQSPIYCDNRMALSYPEVRSFIKKELVTAVREKHPDTQVIAGVATAGIPQGALVADALGLPFIYVRSSPKGHGLENMIEGKIDPGKKVLVIEDLISTGGSSLKAVEALRKAGMEVDGMLAIFTYGFDVARQNFEQAEVSLTCLCSYPSLLVQAVDQDYISDEDMASLQEWRTQPDQWGK